jgi:Tol biopolymer transport system component
MDHPNSWDPAGSVCVIDPAANRTVLAAGWNSEDGLAWSPDGDEIWFTAAETLGANRALWAVDLSGHRRKILTIPGGFTLHDIAPDGRILITVDSERLAMEWTERSTQRVRDLSWYDWSIAKDLSPDGQWVLFEEAGEPAGKNNAVAMRNIDGSAPIRLGDGTVGGFSPDGQWAVSVFSGSPQGIRLMPIGTGQPRQIAVPALQHIEDGTARFLPDGKRVVLDGNLPGRPARSFVVSLAGDPSPRPATPEGAYATLASPDGKLLAGENSDGRVHIFTIADGKLVRDIQPPQPSDLIQWAADGRALFVQPQGQVPAEIERLSLADGKSVPVRELTPTDRAGVISIAPVVTNSNGSEFAYSYYQTLSVLYVISGLR